MFLTAYIAAQCTSNEPTLAPIFSRDNDNDIGEISLLKQDQLSYKHCSKDAHFHKIGPTDKSILHLDSL